MEEFFFEVCLLPKAQALNFTDYLNTINIKAHCKDSINGKWLVYVNTQEDVYKAKRELFSYAQSPYAKRYVQASWQRRRTIAKDRELGLGFFRALNWDPFSFTSIIEIICVLFFICQLFFQNQMLDYFSLTKYIELSKPWEYYRLISPAFLHFGIVHIAFNLVMWESLARPIEHNLGKVKLFSVFVSVVLISNVLQLAFLPPYAVFGGLSGAVYGVIGFAGILSSNKNFAYRLNIPRGLLSVSIIFVLLGFEINDSLANFCHLGGLVVGVMLGLFEIYRNHKNKA